MPADGIRQVNQLISEQIQNRAELYVPVAADAVIRPVPKESDASLRRQAEINKRKRELGYLEQQIKKLHKDKKVGAPEDVQRVS